MRDRSGYLKDLEPDLEAPAQPGPPERRRVRVGLGFYLASVLVVALAVFILMLVQYLPGYRSNYRLSQVIKKSNVELTVNIPMAEVEKRELNPFRPEQRNELANLLKGMGAGSATVIIIPEEKITP